MTLARGLAPAFLRFAGKRSDFLQFQNVKNPAKSRGGPGPDYYLKNYEDGEWLAAAAAGTGTGRTEATAAAAGGGGGAERREERLAWRECEMLQQAGSS